MVLQAEAEIRPNQMVEHEDLKTEYTYVKLIVYT